MCEERRGHEHAFLKIYKPEQAPTSMFTFVNEQMPNTRPDFDQNIAQHQNPFPTFFKNMMSQMMGGRGGCGSGRGGRGGRWGPFGGHGSHGPHGGKAFWNQRKAQLVSYPTQILTGKPGEIIFADIEVENGMHWAWKEGASIQSDFGPETSSVLAEVIYPIDFQVPEKSKFKLQIPIKIKDSARRGDQVYEAVLQFRNAKDNVFGDKIPLKIQVQSEIKEIEYYQMAMTIFEKQ